MTEDLRAAEDLRVRDVPRAVREDLKAETVSAAETVPDSAREEEEMTAMQYLLQS